MKLLFVVPSLKQGGGGTITSLTGLLPLLKQLGHEIFIYVINNSDTNVSINEYATIINIGDGIRRKPSFRGRINGVLRNAIRNTKFLFSVIGIDISSIIFQRVAKSLDTGGYDYVIGFQEGNATQIVSYFTKSKKIAWIHGIYSRMLLMPEYKQRIYDYNRIDKIVCVSKTAMMDLIQSQPTLQNKAHVVYNVVDTEKIKRLATSTEEVTRDNVFKIVSVGRIDSVKRFSEIPRIARDLVNRGYIIHWVIIGGVAEEKEKNNLINQIEGYGVTGIVDWIGHKSNPYPYIKQSDLLVCLSVSETFNYTIAEAKVLDVPIVTTDFPAAFEFVQDGVSGKISSIENVSDTIGELISDTALYESIKKSLNQCDCHYGSSNQVEELFA